MASWKYVYFFPSADRHLQPAKALDRLSCRGLEFDETLRMAKVIDDAGHLEHVDEEFGLRHPVIKDLQERLGQGQQFLVECRNNEISIACCFATRSFNPHFFLGWSRSLFTRLDDSIQHEYWEMIRDFAKASSAAYVVLVDDAGEFEDRFIDIDGRRVLDATVAHKYGHGIQSVWVDTSRQAELPEGIHRKPIGDIGDGFEEYSVPS